MIDIQLFDVRCFQCLNEEAKIALKIPYCTEESFTWFQLMMV